MAAKATGQRVPEFVRRIWAGGVLKDYIYNYSNVHTPIIQLVKIHKIIYIMQNII